MPADCSLHSPTTFFAFLKGLNNRCQTYWSNSLQRTRCKRSRSGEESKRIIVVLSVLIGQYVSILTVTLFLVLLSFLAFKLLTSFFPQRTKQKLFLRSTTYKYADQTKFIYYLQQQKRKRCPLAQREKVQQTLLQLQEVMTK